MPAAPDTGASGPMGAGEGDPTGGDMGMIDSNADGLDDQTGAEMPETNQDDGGDSTVDIINQLSPTDREAVRAYAESMLSRDETHGAEMDQEPAGGVGAAAGGQGVMMEITKGRLIQVQKKLNEMFGDMLTKDDDKFDRKQKKVNQNRKGYRGPFDSPLN